MKLSSIFEATPEEITAVKIANAPPSSKLRISNSVEAHNKRRARMVLSHTPSNPSTILMPDVQRLIKAVNRRTTNVNQMMIGDEQIIQQYTRQFSYYGPMFRMMLVTQSDNSPNIKRDSRWNKWASWSKTWRGMMSWYDQLDQNVEFESNDIRKYQLICNQTGTGFDVDKLRVFLLSHGINNYEINRAAAVHEVIAPYNKTLQTEEGESWNNEYYYGNEDN